MDFGIKKYNDGKEEYQSLEFEARLWKDLRYKDGVPGCGHIEIVLSCYAGDEEEFKNSILKTIETSIFQLIQLQEEIEKGS